MIYYAELSTKEIAEILKKTEDNIRQRRRRALQRLRRIFTDES
jgi:DNA-directed RNA polymerase specialized sigma24 family protein